jgi:hypothetical protein
MRSFGIGALAVDAQLAFADDALDMGERQAGKARFQKAIDAHVVFVGRHHHRSEPLSAMAAARARSSRARE